MPDVIAEIHMVPIGTPTPSVSEYVAEAEKVLRKNTALRHELHAMATTVEGDLESIWQTIRDMQEAMFAKGAQRVSTSLRIDDRRDGKRNSMQAKVDSVNTKLS